MMLLSTKVEIEYIYQSKERTISRKNLQKQKLNISIRDLWLGCLQNESTKVEIEYIYQRDMVFMKRSKSTKVEIEYIYQSNAYNIKAYESTKVEIEYIYQRARTYNQPEKCKLLIKKQ